MTTEAAKIETVSKKAETERPRSHPRSRTTSTTEAQKVDDVKETTVSTPEAKLDSLSAATHDGAVRMSTEAAKIEESSKKVEISTAASTEGHLDSLSVESKNVLVTTTSKPNESEVLDEETEKESHEFVNVSETKQESKVDDSTVDDVEESTTEAGQRENVLQNETTTIREESQVVEDLLEKEEDSELGLEERSRSRLDSSDEEVLETTTPIEDVLVETGEVPKSENDESETTTEVPTESSEDTDGEDEYEDDDEYEDEMDMKMKKRCCRIQNKVLLLKCPKKMKLKLKQLLVLQRLQVQQLLLLENLPTTTNSKRLITLWTKKQLLLQLR
jgi:hypothetical protein